MSLSNALSNAMSGIAAVTRGTEVVSSNLANALTPGFARRELQLSARPYAAGGVHVDGVTRTVRTSVVAQGRVASADTARTQIIATFHKTMADSIGVPGETGALTTLLADFDAALTAAAAQPQSEINLSRVLSTAQTLARSYGTLGAQVQDARTEADRAIASDVQALNDGLAQVAELNLQISVQQSAGDDATALQDSRQQLIDSLSEIVPIQELPRDGGRVALFTAGGAILLDGVTPALIGFNAAGPLAAGMTVEGSSVGRLSLNGQELSAGQMVMFSGGRLAANFQTRDVDAPAAQSRLDAAARDLVERFSDPDVDATRGNGPGLFTDAGASLDPAKEAGLSQRLAVNSAVDIAQGGSLWRLRDGLGASAPGPVGQTALLDRLRGALAEQRISGSSGMSATPRSAATMAADVTSWAATARLGAESALAGATARSDSYDAMIRQDGVDSDQEMETLLGLERAYTANAKVLSAVDDMIQTILRLS